jgi:hypothetical protein
MADEEGEAPATVVVVRMRSYSQALCMGDNDTLASGCGSSR